MTIISDLIAARGIQLGTLTLESAFKESLEEHESLTLTIEESLDTFAERCAAMIMLADVNGVLLGRGSEAAYSAEVMENWLALDNGEEKTSPAAASDFALAVNAGQAELEKTWQYVVKLCADYVAGTKDTIDTLAVSRANSPNEVKSQTVKVDAVFDIVTHGGHSGNAIEVTAVANKLALCANDIVSSALITLIKTFITSMNSALLAATDEEANLIIVEASRTVRDGLVGGLFKYKSDSDYNYMLLSNGIAILLNKKSNDFPAIGLTESGNLLGEMPVAAWNLGEVMWACEGLSAACTTVTNSAKHPSQVYPLPTTASKLSTTGEQSTCTVSPDVTSRVKLAIIDAIAAYYTITNSQLNAFAGLLTSARKLITTQASNLGTAL